jgi:hypothetical protein
VSRPHSYLRCKPGSCCSSPEVFSCPSSPKADLSPHDRLRSSLSSSTPLLVDPQAGSSSGTGTPPSVRAAIPTVVQGPTTLDELAQLAFSEVEDLRSTISGLTRKVTSLESLLVTAFGQLKEDPERRGAVEALLHQQNHYKTEQYTPSAPFPTPLPSAHHLPYSPPVNGDIFISHPSHPSHHSASVSPALSSFPSASTSTLPLDMSRSGNSYGSLGGGAANVGGSTSQRNESLGEDTLREEEVAASLSLEYMALGRRQGAAQTPVRPFSPFLLDHRAKKGRNDTNSTLPAYRSRPTSSRRRHYPTPSSSKRPPIHPIPPQLFLPPPLSPPSSLLTPKPPPSSSMRLNIRGGTTPAFTARLFERSCRSFGRFRRRRGWRRSIRRG